MIAPPLAHSYGVHRNARLQLAPGVELNYRVDDFTDPWREAGTVLLIHGNNESGLAWHGWVPHLARRYKVVRPDMRGFGDSTPMRRDFPWPIAIRSTSA